MLGRGKMKRSVLCAALVMSITLGLSPVASVFADTVPGENGKIAFVSDRDGNDEIYVMDADGIKDIKQFNGVFRGKIAADTSLTPQAEEVSETRWITIEELKQETTRQPDTFTPGIRQVVERYF